MIFIDLNVNNDNILVLCSAFQGSQGDFALKGGTKKQKENSQEAVSEVRKSMVGRMTEQDGLMQGRQS